LNQDPADVVGDGVLAHRGDDADQDAEDDRDDDGEERQLECHREAPRELVEDRLARPVGAAEVPAGDDAADPFEVLGVHRSVEAQVVAEGGQGRGVGVALHHAGGHVARHEAHEGEDQDAHQEERRDRQGQAAEQVPLHGVDRGSG
jgi:hypothetical protein